MKTMAKMKLAKKGLIGNGLLLLIAVVSMAATRQMVFFTRSKGDTAVQQLSFDTLFLKLNGGSETDVLDAPAITMNKQANEYVNNYITRNSETLQEIKDRSSSYFKVTDAVFRKYGLPEELKYLAVVESELQTKALSRVGARGAWQLMPETARILSLKITAKYDERTHFYKSTVAAAKYLRDLHKIFGDWPLVIAAYNSGPGKVFEAIKKSGSRNFWKLQSYLPAETRGHVKRFVATHYYFEGKGSVTTLTKDEVIAYIKLMTTFITTRNNFLKEKQDESVVDMINNNSVNEEVIVKAESGSEFKASNKE
jgi:membrane-bound lytic murein transglycosylase D